MTFNSRSLRPSGPRPRETMDLIRRLEAAVELAILGIAFYLVWRELYRGMHGFPAYFGRGKFVLAGVYVVVQLLTFEMNESFSFGKLKFSGLVISQIVSDIFGNIITYFILSLIANVLVSAWPMLLLTGIDIVIILLYCSMTTIIYLRTHIPRRMVMVYGHNSARSLSLKMGERPDKYRIEKTIPVENGLEHILAGITGFDAVVLNDVDAVIRNDILKKCYADGIRVYVVPKISDIIIRGAEEIALFDTPLLLVRSRGITEVEYVIKRFFDIVLSLIALIPGLPIMGLIAVAIRLDDGGPVFFRQERVTKGQRRFWILKFRSMIVNAEKEGEVRPTEDGDPRITRVGRFIRAVRLDELPQLFNIIKGDMSIVGPRPERVEHVELYTRDIPEFAYRYKVPAGLTGYAQVYGRYNTTAYDKLRLDLMYIEQYSLLLDLKLILMTVRILFTKESTEGFKQDEQGSQA